MKNDMANLFAMWATSYMQQSPPVEVLDEKGHVVGQWMVVHADVMHPDNEYPHRIIDFTFQDGSRASLKYKIN